jgi:hypothetical protein
MVSNRDFIDKAASAAEIVAKAYFEKYNEELRVKQIIRAKAM